VLTLAPVVAALSWLGLGERRPGAAADATRPARAGRPQMRRLAPWFIVGFLAFAGVRAALPLPPRLIVQAGSAASALTVVSMAALGLGVDVRALLRAGPRVSLVVVLSLVVLGVLALSLVRLLALG